MYDFLRNITKDNNINSTNSIGAKGNSTNKSHQFNGRDEYFFTKNYPTIYFCKKFINRKAEK